jgi:uncharacterized protein (DUF58 family)
MPDQPSSFATDANPQQTGAHIGRHLPAAVVHGHKLGQSIAMGVRAIRHNGQGDHFWQFSPYMAGTPTHLIDWRQSAKSDTLYTRQHQKERPIPVYFWLDQAESMAYQGRNDPYSKQIYAEILLYALATAFASQRDILHIIAPSPQQQIPTPRRVPHAPLMQQLHFIANALASPYPATTTAQSAVPHPLSAAIWQPQPPQKNAMIILISDFLTPSEHICTMLQDWHTLPCHVVLVHVLSPSEMQWPFQRATRFLAHPAGTPNKTSAASNPHDTRAHLDIWQPAPLKSAYNAAMDTHIAQLKTLCDAPRWHYTAAHSHTPLMAQCHRLWHNIVAPFTQANMSR